MTFYEDFVRVDTAAAAENSWQTYDETADELGATQVHYDIVDTTRWGQIVDYVFEKNGEFVRVRYTQGSGDSEYPYEPEYAQVKPVEKTVVVYEKV